MRVLTYPNPFNINENQELWDIVSKYPHFCASNTLVQGLTEHYKRTSFGYLTTIEALLEALYKEWLKEPSIDINLFLDVCRFIEEIDNEKIKESFKFNKKEVTQALKFLITLDIDEQEFDKDHLTKDQFVLLEIYKKVKTTEAYKQFNALKEKSITDLEKAIRSTLIHDIENQLIKKEKRDKFDKEIKGTQSDLQQSTIVAYRFLQEEIKELEEVTAKKQMGLSAGKKLKMDKERLKVCKHLKSLFMDEQEGDFDKIVIHGVHKITPLIYFFIQQVEQKFNKEIIILINYCGNVESVYNTWHQVYDWCNKPFEYIGEVDLVNDQQLNPLGKAMGLVLENQYEQVDFESLEDIKVIKYDNLTTFANEEVAPKFINANQELAKMTKQYYAVKGDTTNDILRIYFPEHFKEKQFLSYPIGQFILAIYSMWDFKDSKFKINGHSLVECIAANLYEPVHYSELMDIWKKIKLYFNDIELIDDYKERADLLIKNLQRINQDQKLKWCYRISFYAIQEEQITAFKGFLCFIEGIAKSLFEGKNPKETMDYGVHFKELMSQIQQPHMQGQSEKENEMIDEIRKKLNECKEGYIKGSIKDVGEAINFYLSIKKQDPNSADWIVRNFEQVDGGVLLSGNQQGATTYQLALVSNKHMTKKATELLSWPLDVEMFDAYRLDTSVVSVVTKGIEERKNFLRYSLFYAALFTKKKIELSYVGEEDGEKQSPYYLLKVLNLHEKEQLDMGRGRFPQEEEHNYSEYISKINNDREKKQLFSICPYKFLLADVIKEPIIYYSDFHIRYFVASELYMQYIDENGYVTKNIEILDELYKSIEELFPFWKPIDFKDLKTTSFNNIKRTKRDIDLDYKIKKRNFLIVQWKETIKDENGEEYEKLHMNFNRATDEKMAKYMEDHTLYPKAEDVPYEKVCQYCNYTDICLRNYYEVHGDV